MNCTGRARIVRRSIWAARDEKVLLSFGEFVANGTCGKNMTS